MKLEIRSTTAHPANAGRTVWYVVNAEPGLETISGMMDTPEAAQAFAEGFDQGWNAHMAVVRNPLGRVARAKKVRS